MNLFSEDPQFKRAQYHKLSDNVSEWQEEIAQLVDEMIPTSMGLDTTVVFQKVDEEKGYGVGSVVARDARTGLSVGIPIIIKAWHLAPLDLFFKQDKVLPLNEENLAKAFYHAGLGAGLAPKKPPPQLADEGSIDTRYPPLGGKYTYASAAELVDALRGTTDESDVNSFRGAVFGEPQVLAKFARNRTMDRLLKFAEKVSDTNKKSDSDEKADKLRAAQTLTVKKDGPNEYKVHANPHDLFDPILVNADRSSLRQFLTIQEARFCRPVLDVMNEVDKNGETTIVAPDSPYGRDTLLGENIAEPKGSGFPALSIDGGSQGNKCPPFVFDPKGDDRTVINAEKFGRYGVRDKDGVMAKGFVLPNVVNFDGKKVGEKLFLGGTISAIQNRIAGIPLNDEEKIRLRSETPETGRYGTLVYQEGDQAFATIPFQVMNVSVFQGTRSLGVVDLKGNKMNLILSPAVEGIIPISKSKDLAPIMGSGKNYLVSMKMSFIPMSKLSPVSESSDAFLKKAKAELLDPGKLTISAANGRYIFRGPQLSKYAGYGYDFTSLRHHEASFLLASWGLGPTKIATALEGLKDRICVEVHHLNWVPTHRPLSKTASAQVGAVIRSVKPPMALLVKVAATLEDADAVDSVLSLGFLNPENVARFSGASAALKRTVNMLSKLLLAARLGMEDVPEDAVKSALTHLERVIGGLGKVDMLSKEREKTSSDTWKTAAARAMNAAP